MNARGERILVFGDSLSHHGADAAPEIWDVDQGSSRSSGQPGDLLASLLLEQGAMAARVNARVGRSAANFWGREDTAALLGSDQAFQPTKVIVILGTNDLGVSPQKTADSMLAIKRAYEAMGAEVWAIGPVTYNSDALNAKAPAVVAIMQSVFGSRFIDGRPLSVQTNRAGDGVHFGASSAAQTAQNMLAAVLRAGKLSAGFWTAAAVLVGAGAIWWAHRHDKRRHELDGLDARDPDYSPEMQFKHLIREPGVDAMDIAEDLLLENDLKISKVAANRDGDAGNLDIHPMGAADTPINRVSWRADRAGPDTYESFVTVMWNNRPINVRPSHGAPYSERFLKRLHIANGSKEYAMKWGAAAAWQIARELKRLPPDTKPEIVTEIIDRWNRQEHPDMSDDKRGLYGLRAPVKGLSAMHIVQVFNEAGKHQINASKEGKAITGAGFAEQLATVIDKTARNAAGPIVADIEDANDDSLQGWQDLGDGVAVSRRR